MTLKPKFLLQRQWWLINLNYKLSYLRFIILVSTEGIHLMQKSQRLVQDHSAITWKTLALIKAF
jgi:hypothetical protein